MLRSLIVPSAAGDSEGDSGLLKLIYLARRKPGFTFDEFVRRWRSHGALGMQQSLWRFALGYVQAEPVIPAPIAGASDAYDAVACYMVRDDMFSAMNEQDAPGALAMAEDELRTFSAPIPTTSLWVTEERIRPGELGGVTAFLFFRDAADAREICERARTRPELHRITLNLRDDGAPGVRSNTLPYGAVVELAASDVTSLCDAVGPEGGGLLGNADVAVVTREAVLWNRLPAG